MLFILTACLFAIGNNNAQVQLYGLASEGGSHGVGTVFHYKTSAATQILDKSLNSTIGSYPAGSLTLSGSKFYGMTVYGGANYMEVVDLNGASLLKRKVVNGTEIIDISAYTQGTYLLRYFDGNKWQQVKVMKK